MPINKSKFELIYLIKNMDKNFSTLELWALILYLSQQFFGIK